MTGTKILWGQMALSLAAVLAGLWGATEWTAMRLGFQPALGPAWFLAAAVPVYEPYLFFAWWYHFDAYAPGIFLEGAAWATGGGVTAVVVAIAGSVRRARQSAPVTTYGSARWATEPEVREGGLLGPAGVHLGRLGKQHLRHAGPEHVLCFAPTRSGKGVGLVVPTLLSWPSSVVVHDIKGENWTLTAGWRSRFSHCLLFDPTDLRSAPYNPLLEVRRGPKEVRDVQNIADVLVDPEGSIERRNHWEKTSHSLLAGAILHVLYAEEDKTLAGVATYLSNPAQPIERTLRLMMATPHLGERGVHPVVAQAARELLNKSDNERSGVLSTAMSFLGLYRDPIVARVTSRCDWRISDLVDAEHPVTLYLVVPPSDISRTKPLVRLILNQIGRRLTESLEGVERRHKLLLMLDEFAALGRLDFFETALAFQAGYGIRAFLICQSLNQLAKAYGENNSILDNSHIRVAFACNDERTAKRISDALGITTEQRAMKNYAGHRLSPWLAHLMVSRQETARPLLTPGEVMQLPSTDEIIMVAGLPPIRARKIRYYEDRAFRDRVRPAPVLPASGVYPDRPGSRPDDWTGLVIVPGAPLRTVNGLDELAHHSQGGLRREPELPEQEEIAPDRQPASEFDLIDDAEADEEALKARILARQRLQTFTRAAAMDRHDQMMPGM
ncbi:MAG TPA: conjugal transfer protein TraG [Stellaceae bacterium]|nr:conjugal transfer protein TraG [Stellaceae bacterium]